MPECSRQAKDQMGARKHTCDIDMRRAYAIGVLDSTEDTLKVHMYWLNVQGLRVKAFVVCCLLFDVCCLMFVDYHIFLSFRFHWAVLACLRWSLGTLGLPLGAFGRPLGLHLLSLGVHWGAFGSHRGSLCDHFGRNFSF